MYTIKVTWRGGPIWNPEDPSLFDPAKNKSPVEHLIEHGWQSVEEAFETYVTFKKYPLELIQQKDHSDSSINWITTVIIKSTNEQESEDLKKTIVELYAKKKELLESEQSPFEIHIDVIRS